MSKSAVLLAVGEELYALDSAGVREVVASPRPTSVPAAPEWIVGLINIRGEVVPLVDLAVLLNVGDTPHAAFAVVVSTVRGLAALAATALPQVVSLEQDIGASELPGTSTRHRIGERVAVYMDIDSEIGRAHV